mgnify:CR=1 FL=1
MCVLQVSLFLKDSWISTLRNAIRTSLRDVGKGWFNIHEKNFQVYEISKLKKLMEMVKFIMQVRNSVSIVIQGCRNEWIPITAFSAIILFLSKEWILSKLRDTRYVLVFNL